MHLLWLNQGELAIKHSLACDSSTKAGASLWQTAFGQQTLAIEHKIFGQILRRLQGDSVLWVGDHSASAQLLQNCMVRNPIHLSSTSTPHQDSINTIQASLESLPFKSNSLQGVVLHHALEDVADPRVALREVSRVVEPGGRVILAGYNPWSLVGLRRAYAKVAQVVAPDILGSRRLLNPLRLFDWLTLLGLELDQQPFYDGYGLFLNRASSVNPEQEGPRKALGRFSEQLPFGGILIVSAIKQSYSMNLRNTLQRQSKRLATVAYPRVASWQKVQNR